MGGRSLLPTFFVIGAAKAGTTSINNYLARHPQIEMAEPREPHVMVSPIPEERVALYGRHFRGGTELRGDCSPSYSVYPTHPRVSEHIAEMVPDARIVYMVRDPVERMISYYAQTVVHGVQRQPAAVALDPVDDGNYYLAGSRYATQVEVYLRSFAPDRVMVVDQADLRDRRADVLRRCFAHVGADPDYWDGGFAVEHNVRGSDNVQLGAAGRALRGSGLNAASKRLLPTATRRWLLGPIRRALGGGGFEPEVTPELRARIAEALAPEAARLRELTGQRFATWSV